jgi:hypothetical protein
MEDELETQTEVVVGSNGGLGLVGDEASSLNIEVINSHYSTLQKLYLEKRDATTAFSNYTKYLAEQSGLMPSVIRRHIRLCEEDKISQARKEMEQLSFLLDEFVEPPF